MKPYAILYTSNTGHTCQYAHLLGDCLGLPVYSLPDANEQLPKGSPVIYLGWSYAGGCFWNLKRRSIQRRVLLPSGPVWMMRSAPGN